MKRLPKERCIYSNYNLWETYPEEEMKALILEDYECDDEEIEITDEMIMDMRYHEDEFDWEVAKEDLSNFFLNNGYKWMIFGEVGRWDGIYKAGKLFDKFDDFFYEAAKDCDYIHFYDENGHLYLTCSHHDGTCHYEIKEVTEKGLKYLENWEWGSDSDKRTEREIHTQIFNRYSRLPRFAEKVYGCKRVEYEPQSKERFMSMLNNEAKSFY